MGKKNIIIEVSGRCNLMCISCIRFSRRTLVGDMSYESFVGIIDSINNPFSVSLTLSWLGEPMMNPEIMQIINYSKLKEFKNVKFYTNGTLLDETARKCILSSNVTEVIVSLDYIDKTTYERKKIGSSFDLVKKNINDFYKLKMGNSQFNVKLIVQIFNHFEELKRESFYSEWGSMLDEIQEVKYYRPDGMGKISEVHNNCKHRNREMIIGWDGNVYSCIGDNSCRKPIGNVINDNKRINLEDIYDSREKTNLVDLEICTKCDIN